MLQVIDFLLGSLFLILRIFVILACTSYSVSFMRDGILCLDGITGIYILSYINEKKYIHTLY
jgi:hypothetical protein